MPKFPTEVGTESSVTIAEPTYEDLLNGFLAEKDIHFENARRCLRIVHDVFAFETMIDVGCGIGAWMAAGMSLGARSVTGLDGPWVNAVFRTGALQFPDDITLSSSQITRINMAHDPLPDLRRQFHLAVSIEVAEHLPPERADMLCDLLTGAAEHVLFSAAVPGQGGFQHINEQPLQYWVDKFWLRKFVPLEVVRPAIANDRSMYFWLRRNVVMFVNYAALLRNPKLWPLARTPGDISREWV